MNILNSRIGWLVDWLSKRGMKEKNCPKKKKNFISRARIVKYSVGATKL